jgi:hypothetical protein
MSEIPETDPLSYMNPTSLTDGAVACEAAFGDGTGDSSPPRPIDLLAAMMIDAALEGHPELVDAATVRGAVVVLVVPRGWHEDVAACWRQHVLGHDLRDNDVAKAMDYMLNR